MTLIPRLILDAWPIPELLKGREPSTSQFRRILQDPVNEQSVLSMCRINCGEVIDSNRKSSSADSVDMALRVELKAAYAMRSKLSLVNGEPEFMPLVAAALRLPWIGI
jgi:hypothetical protein